MAKAWLGSHVMPRLGFVGLAGMVGWVVSRRVRRWLVRAGSDGYGWSVEVCPVRAWYVESRQSWSVPLRHGTSGRVLSRQAGMGRSRCVLSW